MQPDPTTRPSQADRDAAAKAVIEADGKTLDIRMGNADHLAVVQAFARHRVDTEKRVRESLAGEANVERVARAIHDGPLGADEYDFDGTTDNEKKCSEWCREVARAALGALERTSDAG